METNAVILRQPDQDVQTKGGLTIFTGTKKQFECFTLELPWKNNESQVSCYPPGTYECEKVGPTKSIPYNHILIKDVPDRAGCCIHIGNFAGLKKSDVRGCTIVGDGYKDINADGVIDIVNSKKTFEKMMSFLPDKFTLTVV